MLPTPTAPDSVVVPVPEINVKLSFPLNAVPLVVPVMLILPARAAPVLRVIVKS